MNPGLRILVTTTDSFGARGGIAQYNRHFLHALSDDPRVGSIVVLPRSVTEPPGALPPRLELVTAASGSLGRYALALSRTIATRDAFDLVVCGHMNLLPFAALAAARFGAQLFLMVYGVEAWRPPARRINRLLLHRVDAIGSISATTRDRMFGWFSGRAIPTFLLPNAFDPAAFAPGPKPERLVDRYGLAGRRNLLILGRMDPTEREKGFDELLEAAPALLQRIPDLAVILAGDGADRPRLEQKARTLGIGGRVVFTGYVPEDQKAELYRLADVFILPSRQEGFGFVLIEAMACGIPSIGSLADGSREAVLDGQIGSLVDPGSQGDIVRAVSEAMERPRRVPEALDYFTLDRFRERVSAMLTDLSAHRRRTRGS